MMRTATLLVALAAAVVASTTLFPREARGQSVGPAPRVCTALWVTAPVPPEKTRAPRRPLVFSATDVLDLELHVILPAAYTNNNLELKLYTPKGHLYQTLKIDALAAGGAAAESARRRRFELLSARLPVAGTTIVNSSLYGIWKAEAYFEGAASPCTRPRRFLIRP
jgi:hypothetical protein